ncbi:hypothetical protein [Lysobacter gummosus]|uniref:Transmembrane protein n=1 Tax=Lysobacter gummosus TaxID=262324 RepID=A0ABY3XI24_9GAMM|nr:hypothetical protein [Lysobacter gummosus]ALN90822.1 hypothetical protein LG3211_1851 [Lysobacter gummosus]UNP31280.1 hypothetical protein MOV92_08600 [Lysobacter gummosus]
MNPRSPPADGIDWPGSARRVRWTAMMVFAALVLALALAAVWMRTQSGMCLILAQIAAAGAAVLRFRGAVLETRLIFAARRCINARWLDVRREDIRQLRRCLKRSIKLAISAWPVALAMGCLPLVMELPGQVAGGERIYAIATLFFVLHFAASEAAYRQLVGALVGSLELERVCVLPA